MVKWRRVIEGECEKMSDIPDGALPIEIEGLEVEGFCVNCGVPLLETDRYFLDVSGELICPDCIKDEVLDPDDTCMDE